jgi:hypothetical protein
MMCSADYFTGLLQTNTATLRHIHFIKGWEKVKTSAAPVLSCQCQRG